MPTLRLKTPHTSVMFKLKRSVSASNEKSNICHHFLQVAHWERLSCQIAVSIWSPNSWTGKRRHSGHWLLGQACGQAGRTRSQGSKTQTSTRLTSSLATRGHMWNSWRQLSSISVISCLVTFGTKYNVFPTMKKNSLPFWHLLKGMQCQIFVF